jgi:hypothetical protein
MEEAIKAYKSFVGKPEENSHSEGKDIEGRIVLKWFLK